MDKENESAEVTSVAKKILASFFDDLGKSDGFEMISARLRKLTIEQGKFSELAIREAIFSDDL